MPNIWLRTYFWKYFEQQRSTLLHKAIDKIPEKQRVAFTLNKYEELTYQQIAEIMDISLASEESLIHRAKKNLQYQLYECYKKSAFKREFQNKLVSYLKRNKMDCKQIHNDLIFFLDNELPEERQLIVKNHLAECAEYRIFFCLLKAEMQVIQVEKNPEVSPFFYTRLSACLEKGTKQELQSLWARVAQPAFFSLMLVAGIYGGIKTGSIASVSPANQPVVSHIQMINDFEAEPIESFLLNKQ